MPTPALNSPFAVSREITEKLLIDRDQADMRIRSRFDGTQVNLAICDPDWLEPTVHYDSISIPLQDPHGEVFYYRGIRELLEYSLVHGYLPKDKVPAFLNWRIPLYLEQIIR